MDLLEVGSNAEATRRRLLSEVLAATQGSTALHYAMVQTARGAEPTAILATHHEDGIRNLLSPPGLKAIHQQLPNVACAAPRECESFLSATQLFGGWDAFTQRPFTQTVRSQLGLGDQIRLLVYHDRRFIGWIGAFRAWGEPPFGAQDRRRVNLLVDRVRTGLIAADTLEQAALPAGPAYLVVTPEGQVEHASETAAPWLTRPRFKEGLVEQVRALDEGRVSSPSLHGAEAVFCRMEGFGGLRYLVCLRRAGAIWLQRSAALTPVQRQVAEYVAAGAHRAEVAEALGVSAETVRSHLRAVYERLGVADRLELARILAEDSN